jgi:hypothetical protein
MQSSQKSETKTDPALMALYTQNSAKANATADTPFQAYSGERIAPFSPTQTAAQTSLVGIANGNIGADGLAQAKAGAQGIVNFQPQQILSPGAVPAHGLGPEPYQPGLARGAHSRRTRPGDADFGDGAKAVHNRSLALYEPIYG